ncbi:hypothetical protein BpHYR1_020020 [Brachionus plicatilis]|uniref:Uncharacterized protein n=1 Tax=Brachionus plicatilis TaxID=10195 RepID=A0A3M7SBH5_BRAPC|nr:hypothetical protein BpHYR1_020020 [Brachionus plicatilis]
MVGDKWHSLNGGDKYGSVFYLKTGGPCFTNFLSVVLYYCSARHIHQYKTVAWRDYNHSSP